MTDEEKKAIEFIKSELEDEKKARDDYQSLTGLYGNLEIEILLNLIEKQSKEIEELKETLKCTQNSWYEDTKIIDKIKAKIEELKKELEDIELKNINKDEISKTTFYFIDRLKCKIEVLESLLEKE